MKTTTPNKSPEVAFTEWLDHRLIEWFPNIGMTTFLKMKSSIGVLVCVDFEIGSLSQLTWLQLPRAMEIANDLLPE